MLCAQAGRFACVMEDLTLATAIDAEKCEMGMGEFDMLPLLIDILKDILTAGTNEESTRVGDVSATATSLKKKYEDAARLLASLPGIDVSLDGQQDDIRRAKDLLRQKRYNYSTCLL
ncbi:hypothetical protein DYB37_010066 [Aphanomyces astaci]|uniref:Mediator of RNA polymerase II transcription subunit 9 n=1 Tax=Aphanomyces astaci TaxID=112090 RepID=A0A3R6XXP7_APHAT|nr:hypothetical protein DYB35_009134 [Aphanomyces astaci]RHZ12924.1 hypothetical protein DYB37_010066 [Aphanomyces astaci]RHZ37910.1 hypothetical protein DYB26_010123 [Aphanomyces astaci]